MKLVANVGLFAFMLDTASVLSKNFIGVVWLINFHVGSLFKALP